MDWKKKNAPEANRGVLTEIHDGSISTRRDFHFLLDLSTDTALAPLCLRLPVEGVSR